MATQIAHPGTELTHDGGLRTLERGLAVLEALGNAESPISLSVIANNVGLPVGTTHRILRTLVANGYVERDLRTKWYELGMKVLELRGAKTHGALRLAAEVRPHLRALSRETKVRVHLAQYRSGYVVYIDRVDPREDSPYVPIGLHVPAHATSLGKAMLAFAPPDEIAAYVSARLGQRFTPATIVDEHELRAELATIRERGYSTDRGEYQFGVACVGAPVFDYSGRAVAAVSVAGTPEQVVPREQELAKGVVATAAAISAKYGFRGPG